MAVPVCVLTSGDRLSDAASSFPVGAVSQPLAASSAVQTEGGREVREKEGKPQYTATAPLRGLWKGCPRDPGAHGLAPGLCPHNAALLVSQEHVFTWPQTQNETILTGTNGVFQPTHG